MAAHAAAATTVSRRPGTPRASRSDSRTSAAGNCSAPGSPPARWPPYGSGANAQGGLHRASRSSRRAAMAVTTSSVRAPSARERFPKRPAPRRIGPSVRCCSATQREPKAASPTGGHDQGHPANGHRPASTRAQSALMVRVGQRRGGFVRRGLVGCASRMPCRREVGLRSNRPSVHILSGCGSRRNGSDTHQVRPSDERTHEDRDHHMFIIGIERHKLSHTAVAVDSFRDPSTRSASMRVAISADFCSSRRRGSSHAPGPSRERGDGCDTRPPARRCRRARGRCATVVAGSGAAVGAAAAGPCRPRRHGPPPPRRRLPRRRHRRLRPESS